ncbi:MAG: YncE family protein [Candidatus Aegiribacteria sp.]|nr:YncE family protein [Candidatus Aegiribacteria sp.]
MTLSKAGEDNSPGTPSQTALSMANSREIGTGAKGSCEVTASWTICGEAAFKTYVLYKSESPGISTDPSSAEVLIVINDVNTTEYIDSDLDWATQYFYALKTTDTNDNGVWSNEVSVDIPVALPDSVITVVGVGDYPYGICSSPSGDYVYVANYSSNNVSIIRTSDNTIAATVDVGDGPWRICSSPSGNHVYVANAGSNIVSIIRTSDNTVVATVGVGYDPFGICSLPTGDYVYVANCGSHNVSIIRTSDNNVLATVDVGYYPLGICSLPSGDYVYVTNSWNDNVSVIH